MRNEFGDEFTADEIEDIADRVRRLSGSLIDELWSLCGWSDANRGVQRSLPPRIIEDIRNNAPERIRRVVNLISETPKQELLQNLSLLENRPQP